MIPYVFGSFQLACKVAISGRAAGLYTLAQLRVPSKQKNNKLNDLAVFHATLREIDQTGSHQNDRIGAPIVLAYF